MPTASSNVRVRGQSGKYVLVLRSSQFDPKATSPRLKALRIRPNRRMKMANAPALIGHRDQHGEARWRLDDASSLVCENVSIPANRTAFSETTMVEYSS